MHVCGRRLSAIVGAARGKMHKDKTHFACGDDHLKLPLSLRMAPIGKPHRRRQRLQAAPATMSNICSEPTTCPPARRIRGAERGDARAVRGVPTADPAALSSSCMHMWGTSGHKFFGLRSLLGDGLNNTIEASEGR